MEDAACIGSGFTPMPNQRVNAPPIRLQNSLKIVLDTTQRWVYSPPVMQTQFETIHFEHRLEIPTETEQVLFNAVSLLPDSAPKNIAGFDQLISAGRRRIAAKRILEQAESDLKDAADAFNREVCKQWSVSEIPDETYSLLNIWGRMPRKTKAKP